MSEAEVELLWYWPGNARRFHLFEVGALHARSLCAEHNNSGQRIRDMGREERPVHDVCRTCDRAASP